MRELTKSERENRVLSWAKWIREHPKAEESFTFNAGFIAGLDYAQRKLDAYAAYVAGKITLKELEEVINQ